MLQAANDTGHRTVANSWEFPQGAQELTREDYEKILRYLGYALLVLHGRRQLRPEEAAARAALTKLRDEFEDRESQLPASESSVPWS